MWKSFNNKSGDTFYSQRWFCAASITRRHCFTRALQAPNAAVFQGNPTKGLLPISKPWEEQSSNITRFLLQTGKLHVQGVAEALRGAWLFIGPINILLRPCELNKQTLSVPVPLAGAGSCPAIAGFSNSETPLCCRSLAGPFWTEYRKVQQCLFDTT